MKRFTTPDAKNRPKTQDKITPDKVKNARHIKTLTIEAIDKMTHDSKKTEEHSMKKMLQCYKKSYIQDMLFYLMIKNNKSCFKDLFQQNLKHDVSEILFSTRYQSSKLCHRFLK